VLCEAGLSETLQGKSMERRTVLITLDGSAVAEAALPYGRALAAALGARVELFSVVERLHGILPTQRNAADRALHAAIADLESYLDAVTEQVFEQGSNVFRCVIGGDPAEEILAASREADTAAVVMATHGRGGVRRAVLGSVADKVLRQARTPLLIVRPREDRTVEQRLHVRRIMTPLDGSKLAETALPLATELAQASGASLLLVRAQPPMATHTLAGDYMPDFSSIDRELMAQAERYLVSVRAGLPEQITVETVAAPFDGMELPFFAERNSVDLVVMTTRGLGGLQRLLLGSVADRMVRLGPPVLLVPPTAAATEAEAPQHVAQSAQGDGPASLPRVAFDLGDAVG
jgi:nucleotide-binding universal stress UspA family protein